MVDCPDHPVVQNLCRTGYPDGREPEVFCCPICGADAENFYTTVKTRTIVGCEICLMSRPYWEFEMEELS
jgi:transcription elongation factor Elf1